MVMEKMESHRKERIIEGIPKYGVAGTVFIGSGLKLDGVLHIEHEETEYDVTVHKTRNKSPLWLVLVQHFRAISFDAHEEY